MQPRNIIITGASSGIGAALARNYAGPGVTLGLLGRDAPRLAEVAAACEAKGASVRQGGIDVRDAVLMRDWLKTFAQAHPPDLLIANAGISAGPSQDVESDEQMRLLFAVNVDGVINSVLPVIGPMRARGQGQIAVMGSLAGLRGLPSCPAYSASKMAVRGWGEALRGALKKTGITVSVICPGYIRTPMTQANRFPMPFIMSADKAAEIIRRGLEKNRSRIAFPLALYLPMCMLNALPLWLADPLFAALPKKGAGEKL